MSHRVFRHVEDRHLRKWLNRVAGEKELRRAPTYEELWRHIPSHNIQRWLIRGAMEEKAVTIGCAIARLTEDQVDRRVGRMIARDRNKR